jgi:hypothetical protein
MIQTITVTSANLLGTVGHHLNHVTQFIAIFILHVGLKCWKKIKSRVRCELCLHDNAGIEDLSD